MKKNVQETAPLVPQLAYKLGGITYVPHYRNSSVYVGPGYHLTHKRYSAEQLVLAGAAAVTQMLWIRGNYGVVTDGNP
jgi:hypothetical protein